MQGKRDADGDIVGEVEETEEEHGEVELPESEARAQAFP
jgi:hypothetical protein